MLSAVAKVFEKLISNQLYIYLETNGILILHNKKQALGKINPQKGLSSTL